MIALLSLSKTLDFSCPKSLQGAHCFDVQSIFVVAFQCNNNLSALFYANTLPAGNISKTIPFRLS